MNIETKGLGAGSYPEPNESELKCFNFKATIYSNVSGYVWAKNEEEAEDLIYKMQWEEIENGKIEEVYNVEELEEE